MMVRDYVDKAMRELPLAVADLLSHLSNWKSISQLRVDRRFAASFDLTAVLDELHALGLVESSDDPPHPIKSRLRSWDAWSPEAPHFHFATKDVPPSKRGRRLFHELLQQEEFPDMTKAPSGAPIIKLPGYPRRGAFVDVLLARRSWRRFGKNPMTLTQLAALLGLTWGVQRWMDVAPGARVPLKTSPSGGACHSLEVYVLVQHVRGLARGVYRYCPDSHMLERVRDRLSSKAVAAAVNGQSWFADCSALFLMTSVIHRVQWKYRFSRAYRVLLLEAGHFCQTFCLVATWLGLAPFCTAALSDSATERSLGINGVDEVLLYAAGSGTRPASTTWAPFPTAAATPPTSLPHHARRGGRRRGL
jgi:SagB-type dehydrogenase family enzyme